MRLRYLIPVQYSIFGEIYVTAICTPHKSGFIRKSIRRILETLLTRLEVFFQNVTLNVTLNVTRAENEQK